MLVALGDLASAQFANTKNTPKVLTKLFNYPTDNPNTEVAFQKSNKILYINSDASYLSVSKCISRGDGCYLSNNAGTTSLLHQNPPPLNEPIYVISKNMRNIVASAAESELGSIVLQWTM